MKILISAFLFLSSTLAAAAGSHGLASKACLFASSGKPIPLENLDLKNAYAHLQTVRHSFERSLFNNEHHLSVKQELSNLLDFVEARRPLSGEEKLPPTREFFYGEEGQEYPTQPELQKIESTYKLIFETVHEQVRTAKENPDQISYERWVRISENYMTLVFASENLKKWRHSKYVEFYEIMAERRSFERLLANVRSDTTVIRGLYDTKSIDLRETAEIYGWYIYLTNESLSVRSLNRLMANGLVPVGVIKDKEKADLSDHNAAEYLDHDLTHLNNLVDFYGTKWETGLRLSPTEYYQRFEAWADAQPNSRTTKLLDWLWYWQYHEDFAGKTYGPADLIQSYSPERASSPNYRSGIKGILHNFNEENPRDPTTEEEILKTAELLVSFAKEIMK